MTHNIWIAIYLLTLLAFYQFQFNQYHPINTPATKHHSNTKSLKVILIIIDALRTDYSHNIPFFQQPTQSHQKQSNGEEYYFLEKCWTGNPTMTTQRLQTLMTGSQVFSSMNVLQTFFSEKIPTDNLISQLARHNKSTIVFGDDTWSKLFDVSNQSKLCPSTFDISDYDTCDDLVYKYLLDSLDKSDGLVIGHFLSIDHIGHATSSISGELVQIKLSKISDFLFRIGQRMSDDSMLIVTGDHGMRNDGNHGGSSPEEIQTLLFAYYKGSLELQPHKQQRTIIRQSDITTTLSWLLNVPTPTNSIGLVIEQLLPRPRSSRQSSELVNERGKGQRLLDSFEQFQSLVKYHSIELPEVEVSEMTKMVLQCKHELESNESSIQLVKKCNSHLQALLYHLRDSYLSVLSYTHPDDLKVLLCIGILLICSLALLHSHYHQYYLTSNLSNCFNAAITILTPFLLFTCYFSWFLIRNTSTILAVTSLLLILQAYSFHQTRPIFPSLILLLLLCQFEPTKNNQYLLSWLKISSADSLINNPYTLLFINFIVSVLTLSSLQKNKSTKNYALFGVLCLLSFDQISMIFSLEFQFRLIATCISIILICFQVSLDKEKRVNSDFLVVSLIALVLPFLGKYGLVMSFVSFGICKMYSGSKSSGVSSFYLAELVWWMMGNRYEYSGIDIKKSYVFYQEYHPLLNPICLLVSQFAPYFIVFVIIRFNHNLHSQADQKGNQHLKADQKGKESTLTIKQFEGEQEEQKLRQENIESGLKLMKKKRVGKDAEWDEEWILMSVLSVTSCSINLYLNNEKILFTVVYVPLILFNTLKCFMITALVKACQFISPHTNSLNHITSF